MVVVHIRFETDGGMAFFPGLNQPIEIDTSQLTPSEGAEIERLVEAAHFFQQAVESPPPSEARDYRQYTITVDQDGRSHTVRVVDPIADPALQALVRTLQTQRR